MLTANLRLKRIRFISNGHAFQIFPPFSSLSSKNLTDVISIPRIWFESKPLLSFGRAYYNIF